MVNWRWLSTPGCGRAAPVSAFQKPVDGRVLRIQQKG
jgi:hypothetical protein